MLLCEDDEHLLLAHIPPSWASLLSTSQLWAQLLQMNTPPNLTHPLHVLTHSPPKPIHFLNIDSMVKKT